MKKSGFTFRHLIPSLRISPYPPKYLKQVYERLFTSQAEAASSPYSHALSDDEYANIDWDKMGFALTPTDYMYVMKGTQEEDFVEGKLNPYGTIELSPAAGVLNYAQGLFEGMKAMRREDGRIFLFRPEQNALRMKMGAERMCMPSPSVDHFIDAVKKTALANRRWIPPPGKGSLYMRPLLLGTGPILGLGPAPEYTFLVYASPVRNYFKEGSAPLDLYVEDEYGRASRGGAGGVKTIGNYGPALRPMMNAKKMGFSDVLYLDAATKKYIEEVSSCNIFIVKDNVISTPPANKGTILPGVTRKSIIQIARDHGHKVEEREILVEELLEADEVFGTGTAVVIAPVGSVTYNGKRVEYKKEAYLCKKLLSEYTAIQSGMVEDKRGWMVEIN